MIQMNQDNQNPQDSQAPAQQTAPKTVTTTVTCPHCGKTHEVTVEVPEAANAPGMVWQG